MQNRTTRPLSPADEIDRRLQRNLRDREREIDTAIAGLTAKKSQVQLMRDQILRTTAPCLFTPETNGGKDTSLEPQHLQHFTAGGTDA